ncbi:Uncharacterized protein FKW44_020098 [Caligus rogercresseyi]|uniref:Uncharacterized protein n=1 Tax=Caligus rogercresseyi TaxID=217165 RepID=A0A7T8GXB2_CALRO|nr:Uncharacterized protein FKW44_020098 [Caligus rogercresseyi]
MSPLSYQTRPQEELHQGSKGNLRQYPKEPKKISKAVVKNWCYDPKELKARAEE